MTTRTVQVITDASACRCLDASDRTSASVSRALASIWSMIFPPSQVTKRVSRIAPVTSRTISSPLPRAHRPMSGRREMLEDIASHHGGTGAGKYSQVTVRRTLRAPGRRPGPAAGSPRGRGGAGGRLGERHELVDPDQPQREPLVAGIRRSRGGTVDDHRPGHDVVRALVGDDAPPR